MAFGTAPLRGASLAPERPHQPKLALSPTRRLRRPTTAETRAQRRIARREATEKMVQEARWRGIWRLYWPLALTMAMQVLVSLVDAWVAGQLGAQALAIVGLSLQVVMLVNALAIAVGVGTHAVVARSVGSRDWDEAGAAARQSVLLGVGMTLLLAAPLALAAPFLYDASGLPAADRAMGVSYVRWIVAGVLPMNVGIVLTSVLRARGSNGLLLWASLAEAVTWLGGSLVLALGLGWGLVGLGMGFALGKSAQMLVAAFVYSRSRLFSRQSWKPCLRWQHRILRIGLPSAAHVVLRNVISLSYFAILGLLAYATDAVAAYSVGLRIEAIAYLLVFGLGAVAATMVGQHLGAARPEKARKAVRRILTVALGVSTLLAGVGFYAAESIALFFCNDPLTWVFASGFVAISALALPAMAATVVLNGAFQGAGDTRSPMVIALLTQGLVGLPLTWLLACHTSYGMVGAWAGMAIATTLQGTLAAIWWLNNRWQERRV